MEIFLIVIHVIVCIALIMIVLLQTGKGADMGAAFGGGGSQTLFGSSGASTFLSKATTVAAIVFMLTSLFLAYASSNQSDGSVVTDTPPAASEGVTDQPSEEQAPKLPATPEATQPKATQPKATQSEQPKEDSAATDENSSAPTANEQGASQEDGGNNN